MNETIIDPTLFAFIIGIALIVIILYFLHKAKVDGRREGKQMFHDMLEHNKWLDIRDASEDEWGEKLCYCGHTNKCSCGDPDLNTFKDSVNRGTIILDDPDNGWKTIEDEEEISN